ncbi:MAG: zonular occludens toxin domain-containing protein [Candidatus Scalindua sp.]|nr:zonular occludens toxin domain-containing protein [Candidatus Scalindua sp.]
MAIKIIEGKIGSGKTYYAVHNIFKKWYRWCDEIDEWVPKEFEFPLRVYTNIEQMKLGFDLNVAIEEAGGLNPFFTREYQEKFCEDANVIYIIDEAQSHDLFHRTYRDKPVLTFFQRSRHTGNDVYLITQDTQCLVRELRALAEYHIVAVQRTKSIGNCFTYKFYAGKDHFKTKRIRIDNKVFSLYRSMIVKEAEKVKSAVWKYIIMFVVIISLAGVMFKFVFLNIILGMGNSPSQKPQQEIVKSILKDPIKTSEDLNNDDMYRIIGIVDNHYIVKTHKGLKKVKIDMENKKNINDEIKMEKL